MQHVQGENFLQKYMGASKGAPFILQNNINNHVSLCVCVCVRSLSRVWLYDPMDCSSPGSSVRGIFQTRILEWVAIPFSRGTSRPRDQTWVSHITDRRFTVWATREATSYRRNNIWWKHREWVLNICYAVNLRGVFKRLNVGFVHQKHKS